MYDTPETWLSHYRENWRRRRRRRHSNACKPRLYVLRRSMRVSNSSNKWWQHTGRTNGKFPIQIFHQTCTHTHTDLLPGYALMALNGVVGSVSGSGVRLIEFAFFAFIRALCASIQHFQMNHSIGMKYLISLHVFVLNVAAIVLRRKVKIFECLKCSHKTTTEANWAHDSSRRWWTRSLCLCVCVTHSIEG